jgi:hypothetical protein
MKGLYIEKPKNGEIGSVNHPPHFFGLDHPNSILINPTPFGCSSEHGAIAVGLVKRKCTKGFAYHVGCGILGHERKQPTPETERRIEKA